MQLSYIRDVNYIKVLGESLNVTLGDEACRLIGSEIEYTLRLVIQVFLIIIQIIDNEEKECY